MFLVERLSVKTVCFPFVTRSERVKISGVITFWAVGRAVYAAATCFICNQSFRKPWNLTNTIIMLARILYFSKIRIFLQDTLPKNRPKIEYKYFNHCFFYKNYNFYIIFFKFLVKYMSLVLTSRINILENPRFSEKTCLFANLFCILRQTTRCLPGNLPSGGLWAGLGFEPTVSRLALLQHLHHNAACTISIGAKWFGLVPVLGSSVFQLTLNIFPKTRIPSKKYFFALPRNLN